MSLRDVILAHGIGHAVIEQGRVIRYLTALRSRTDADGMRIRADHRRIRDGFTAVIDKMRARQHPTFMPLPTKWQKRPLP